MLEFDYNQTLMNTFTIDTNNAIQRLEAKGFSRTQAEGVVDVLSNSRLVTIDYMDKRFSDFEAKIYKAMLIQTGAIAAVVFGMLQFVVV